MPAWMFNYWYIWILWPLMFAPGFGWLWWQYRKLKTEPWSAARLYGEIDTLKRAIIVIIEAESSTQDHVDGFHVHDVIKPEDRRQIEVMLGIQSD